MGWSAGMPGKPGLKYKNIYVVHWRWKINYLRTHTVFTTCIWLGCQQISNCVFIIFFFVFKYSMYFRWHCSPAINYIFLYNMLLNTIYFLWLQYLLLIVWLYIMWCRCWENSNVHISIYIPILYSKPFNQCGFSYHHHHHHRILRVGVCECVFVCVSKTLSIKDKRYLGNEWFSNFLLSKNIFYKSSFFFCYFVFFFF